MFRNTNGVYDKNQNGSIDADELAAKEDFYLVIPTDDMNFSEGYHVQMELQYDPDHPNAWYPTPVVNDLLNNADNRGLIMGKTEYWNRDTQQWEGGDTGIGTAEWGHNGCFVSHDKDNAGQWPRIIIEIVALSLPPHPGDANDDGAVDGADYTLWADNYNQCGKGWGDGDFTGDGCVDGADYTIWADNYGWTSGGAAVPEPATLLLLAVGGAAAAIRRRR
jgi:hypothetical protein